jgi:hypothetical protein
VRYSVALVVDPEFGDRLRVLSSRLHVWIVDSPCNRPAAEAIWIAKAAGEGYSNEAGVTTFEAVGATAEDWCIGIIDSVDDHHNSSSHNPGYTVLEVYGAAQSQRIRESLKELGFVRFIDTPEGFNAKKTEP